MMTLTPRMLARCSLWLLLTGWAAAMAEPLAPPPLVQLGPGDQVKIDVFGNPDLATTTSVTDDGKIRMPLAGAVDVAGQSLAEAAHRLERALKDGQYLVDPQVTVNLVQSVSQRVSVFGEVKTPGSYPIQSSSTVFDLIAQAGGISEKGSDVVYIQRADKSGTLRRIPVDLRKLNGATGASALAETALRSGDTIIVPKGTFFIVGQVVKPGEYRIEGEMMLFEAIAHAGGVTPLGSTSRVEVRRRDQDGKVVEVKDKKNLIIQPGDVINVKERLF